MDATKWKEHKDFPNWMISSEGEVYSKKLKRLLKASNCSQGYPRLSYRKNGEIKYIRVHRLVAELFVENPENKPYVNHINCNRSDNRAINLEWVTPKENASGEKGNAPLGLEIGRRGRHSRRRKYGRS